MMTVLLILWAGLSAILIGLLIYRGTLNMHEDDQLFLDSANAHMAKEQAELLVRIDRVQPWVRIFGACSTLLLLVIVGVQIYLRLNQL